MKNSDKTLIAKVLKLLNAINFNCKHSWIISNADINATKDLKMNWN